MSLQHSWFRTSARIEFCIRFTRLEAMSLQQSLFRESARIEFLYCVLHALRRCHCNIVGSAGVPVLGFCIVFYTLWGHQSWLRRSARIELLYCFYALCCDATATKSVPRYSGIQMLCCVLHAMRLYHCNRICCAAFRNWAVVLCCARSEAIDTMKLFFCQTSTRRRRNHKNMYHIWHVVKSYSFSNNSEAMFEATGQET